jgi:hypothetical protein
MAVMLIAEIEGQTESGYGGMFNSLSSALKQADGFVLHTAYPVNGGWRVIEIWSSKSQADRFFAEHVAPNLPPGILPKLEVQPLHNLLAP